MIGVEALIRWPLPGAFLPAVENHFLEIEIGEWVVETALIQIAEWRAVGLELPISVNVGANQLPRSDFSERLEALTTAHPEVPPS